MSEDPFKWYDLQIVEPVYETKPKYNERDDYAIIFSDEINQSNIDLRQKPALLCSVHKTEKNIIYVTSLYQVYSTRGYRQDQINNSDCACRAGSEGLYDCNDLKESRPDVHEVADRERRKAK
jgi:hypothetical protein